MAIHGLPRATVDVDLIAPAKADERVLEIARTLGYTIPADPMPLAAVRRDQAGHEDRRHFS